ncbi:V-type H+-transporting ATPase subunit a [Nematocida ausubeli]|nr:V-type H+-transporting ATPase subunit a [Nematocida ausubeli]
MFRSEDVSMVRLYISPDIARNVIEELGQRDILHLIETKQKPTEKSQHALDMERILARIAFLSNKLTESKVTYIKGTNIPPLNTTIEALSKAIEKHYYRIAQLSQIMKDTKESIERLEEDVLVLQDINRLTTEGFKDLEFESNKIRVGLEYVAGVISKDQIFTLEAFLWKSLHGNLCFVSVEMTDPHKMGFICFTHGERAIERVRNICTRISARIITYDSPGTQQKQNDLLNVSENLSHLTKLHKINEDAFSTEIKTVSRSIVEWKYYIIREIEIEIALSKLSITQDKAYLTGEGFILTRNETRFGQLIKKISETHGDAAAEIISDENTIKPTYFDTNPITQCFQDLTNVYSTPAYKEINPTILSITTFPFLFGAMFGDVGHGIIFMGIGIFFIRWNKTSNMPDMISLLYNARYVLVIMGIWAVYFGFLYGDCMGYAFGQELSAYKGSTKMGNCIFGIDHSWHLASNSSVFINSLKMKMSIVLGFIHITAGMCLGLINSVYKQDIISVICTRIPQFVIFMGLIGYMVFLIILKWCTGGGHWPGIISILIDMSSFKAPAVPVYMYQNIIEKFIMISVFISGPIMLLGEPVYRTVYKNIPKGSTLADVWLHSLIEGIEFTMGLISNISSYLRLWAVSLAHAELSAILYSKTLGNTDLGIIAWCLGSVIWGCATIMLLIGLEGLSATLHSLRLHWVEFGSKFFKGDGVLFTPFTFRPGTLLNPDRVPGGEE